MGQGFRIIDESVKQEYLEWLLTIPTERELKTKAAIAEHLGVSVPTLRAWERSDAFQQELRKLKAKWSAQFEAEIFGRLISIVEKGTDTAAIQAAKVLLPHMDSSVNEAREADLTNEHLAAIRKALEESGYQVISGDK